jgi:hypothetical protein
MLMQGGKYLKLDKIKPTGWNWLEFCLLIIWMSLTLYRRSPKGEVERRL